MTCGMASLYDSHDHYKRMFELQEKLRKSEEERIRLEERFNMLVRESHDRHDACINRLRLRYIQYLEEQRTRDERNHKLLAALDKVTNKLALISAKKDKLNVLRKQYEAYLLRVYANRRQPGSVIADSGIASQNEDKCTRKSVTLAQSDIASAETRNVLSPQVYASAQSNQKLKSTSTTKLHDQIVINNISLNNSSVLPTTPGAPIIDADHYQTCVSREPHVYVSPISQSSEQLAQASTISSAKTYQYPQTISDYDGSAFNNLQNVTNFRTLHTKAPILSMTSLNQIQSDAVPVNRFFKEHMEPVQTAISDFSTSMQFPPIGKSTQYERSSQHEPIPSRFDSVTAGHDANIMLSNPKSRVKRFVNDLSDVAKPTLMTAKSSTYRIDPSTTVIDEVSSLPEYMDYITASPQKSEDEGSIHSLTSDDVDDLIRRNEHLLWKSMDDAKTPCRSPIDVMELYNANLHENGRTTAILENELDRYISKIRRLHREHNLPSLEELDHEQNTSGDLLNDTISEDAVELPVEDRAKKEQRVSEKIDKILASNLISNTTGSKEVAQNTVEQNGNDNLPVEVIEDEIRHCEATTDDTLQFEGKREAERHESSEKNEVREDIATHLTELEQMRRNAEIAKESWNNADDLAKLHNQEISTKKDDTCEKIVASLNNESQIDDRENALKKKQFDFVIGKESNIEDLFDVTEELMPWNLANMQKEIRELHLDDFDEDQTVKENRDAEETENRITSKSHVLLPFIEQSGADDELKNASQDMLSHVDMQSKKLDAFEANESHETRSSIENVEDMTFQISNQHKVDESKISSQVNEDLNESKENNDKKQDNDETMKSLINDRSENITKNNEYNVEQEYIEDSNQERYEQDSNEQYQGMSYEEVNKDEYERYAAQGYAQEGQEYVEYVDSQYEQYPEDPNNPQYQHDLNAQYEQYPEDPNNPQYQHDPNAQYEQDLNQAYDYNYDPNQEYDPNQQYIPGQEYDLNQQYNPSQDYDPNQQYNPGQEYDPNQQSQEYDPNQQGQEYDPNQQGQEYDPNQQGQEYDPNQQGQEYDPNQQGQEYDPNQQYDPRQEYGNSSDNQAYNYIEQVSYDPNHDNVYEQEYKEEQHYPNNNIVVENRKEESETEETSQRQTDTESERKSNRNDDESQQVDAVNGMKKKNVIKSLLDSDTDTTIEKNVSNTESDFDFN